MLSPLFNQLLIPFLMAMFMAITMGGSGTAPSFSAAYGAGVIRKSIIPGVFGIMVFLGAIIAGKGTASTIGKGLLAPELMSFEIVSIILFAVAVSLLIANLSGIPQSTSQSTVFAVSAAAFHYHSMNADKLFLEIIPTWFILPVISFFVCFLIAKYIYKPIRKKGYTISKKVNESQVIKTVIVIMSMYVAFSIGSNNVANAAGPVASMTANELGIDIDENFILIMILATLIVAPCFGIGSSLFGYRILKKTGKEIVLFGRVEAVIISFVSASLLLMASVTKGIPTSLVQLNVAAILGIGVAKLGFQNIFRKTQVNRFFFMWMIAPLISSAITICCILLAEHIGIIS